MCHRRAMIGPRLRWAIALVAASFVVACGEDERPASWRYIHASIIHPNCATVSCHTSENAQAGLRLDTAVAAYAILVGRPCGEEADEAAPGNYVVPYQPERSQLMHLLIGDNVRRPMPPDRLLPDPDIALIERWILEGAPCE